MKLLTTQTDELDFLHQKSNPVLSVESIKSEIKWMKRFLSDNNGFGLAAPQLGVLLTFFVFKTQRNVIELVINPKIINFSEKKIQLPEHCFSCPGITKIIPRSNSIKVSYFNGKKEIIKEFNRLESIIFQHEYDHLNGIIISD